MVLIVDQYLVLYICIHALLLWFYGCGVYILHECTLYTSIHLPNAFNVCHVCFYFLSICAMHFVHCSCMLHICSLAFEGLECYAHALRWWELLYLFFQPLQYCQIYEWNACMMINAQITYYALYVSFHETLGTCANFTIKFHTLSMFQHHVSILVGFCRFHMAPITHVNHVEDSNNMSLAVKNKH